MSTTSIRMGNRFATRRWLVPALCLVALSATARADDTKPTPAPDPAASTAATTTSEPRWNDPSEPPGKRQYFLGLRYRGVLVPQFLINLFTLEGKNVLVHSGGIEFEVRRDHFALVPHLVYARYQMDDTLFLEKNKDKVAGSYSFANADMHAIYAGIDMLWSVPINRYFDFEAGLGVGVGYVFGTLVNNWVKDDPNGQFTASDGKKYGPCTQFEAGTSCDKANHTNATVNKVGRFVEPNWLGGGSVPSFYARITAPILGFRIKPIRALAIRLNVALSLTEGFMFGGGLDFMLPGS